MTTKATHSRDRTGIQDLTEIINVGTSVADDLRRIGISRPQQLIGRDPWEMYRRIGQHDGVVQDPCLLDVLWAAVDYMEGGRPKKWWSFTAARKTKYSQQIEALRREFSGDSRRHGNKKRRGQGRSA